MTIPEIIIALIAACVFLVAVALAVGWTWERVQKIADWLQLEKERKK